MYKTYYNSVNITYKYKNLYHLFYFLKLTDSFCFYIYIIFYFRIVRERRGDCNYKSQL